MGQRRWVWAAAGALVVIAATGVWLARSHPRFDPAGDVPVAWVVAETAGATVRAGWWRLEVAGARAFGPGERLHVGEGEVVHVLGGDGRVERVPGPGEFTTGSVAANLPSQSWAVALPAWLERVKAPAATHRLGPIATTAPAGTTRHTRPTLDWLARADRTYDVALHDPSDPVFPPRVATDVRPPVAWEQLSPSDAPPLRPDRIYELVVREREDDSTLTSATFLVRADATAEAAPQDAAGRLIEAAQALVQPPYRTGDAWLALRELPAPWGSSGLAERLRLRVTAELGLTEKYEATRALLEQRLE